MRGAPAALAALALGTFGIGLTEFGIVGLLPEVAADLRVDDAAAGWLVSGYALTVAIGAIVVTLAVGRLDRKQVLIGLLALFVVGNALCGLAPTYELVLVGRIVAALCHGAYFGIGSLIALSVAGPDRGGRAIGIMVSGLSLSNVLGVPLGTLLGQQAGWRVTFLAIAAIGVLAAVAITMVLPRIPGGGDGEPGAIGQLRGLLHAPVLHTLGVTGLLFAAVFGAVTYIAFVITDVSGFATGVVPWLLIAFGAGQFAGTLLGGRAADRRETGTVVTVIAGLAVVLVLFAATASIPWLALIWLILLGGLGFAAVPGLQGRAIRLATGAPTLASSATISVVNVGITVGSWLGGVVITAGAGYTGPLWVSAALAAASLLLFAIPVAAPRTPAEPLPAGPRVP